jgi:hypothetical protein
MWTKPRDIVTCGCPSVTVSRADFYTSFPADRDVPFEEVLKKLSDSEDMTPQQMHEWFKEHRHKK